MLQLVQKLFRRPAQPLVKGAVEGYDLWAATYDSQPGNLMLDLDEAVFSGLLGRIDLAGRTVADIGCGTGRHWPKLLAERPAALYGFDVSAAMLEQLRKKFPGAQTSVITDDGFGDQSDAGFDAIVSTLTVAHIEDIAGAIRAWSRMLKPGGDLLITDFHPAALGRGGRRTFADKGRTITLVNYVHPVDMIRDLCAQSGLRVVLEAERRIDEGVRHYYKAQQALPVYEAFFGVPMIYGIHLKKLL